MTKALDEATDIDLGGIIPPWTPSKPGPEGQSRLSNTSLTFVTVDNGDPVSLMDAAVPFQDIVKGTFNARVPAAVRRAMGE